MLVGCYHQPVNLNLMLKLRMNGAILSLHLYAFMTCVRTALLLPANGTKLTAVCVAPSQPHYCGRRKRQTVVNRTERRMNTT